MDRQSFFTADGLSVAGNIVFSAQVKRSRQRTPWPPTAVAVGQCLASRGSEIRTGQATQQDLN